MGIPPPPSPLVPPPRPWAIESPPAAPKMNPWPLMIAGGRVLGLILIFVGSLIAVLGASIPGSCFPTGCSGFATQAANSILAGKLLWVFGLFCIAGASGLRLQGGIMPGSAPSSSNEDGDAKVARIRGNLLMLVICILLMALILLTINILPPILSLP